LSGGQLFVLLVLLVTSTGILFLPSITAQAAAHSAPAAALLGSVMGLGLLFLFWTLSRRHPGQSLTHISRSLLGPFPGTLAAIGFGLFFLFGSAVIAREFGEFLVISLMPETPIEIFTVVILFLTSWASLAGIEVLARNAQFIMPLVVGSLLVILLLALPHAQLINVLPLAGYGYKPILFGALVPLSWFGETVLAIDLLAVTKKSDRRLLFPAAAVSSTGVLLTAAVLVTVMVFGCQLTGRMIFATFETARVARLAMVLERMDPFLVAVWLMGVYVKLALTQYAAVSTLAEAFKLTDYRILVVPAALLIYAWSLGLWADINEIRDFLSKIWPLYSLGTVELLLPAVLLLVSFIRGGGGGPK